MKKTLKDMYVYDVLGLDRVVPKCAEVNQNLDKAGLPPALVEAISGDIRYKISLPGKNLVLDELKTGSLVLVDSAETASVPTWMVMKDGKISKAVVNLFGRIRRKDGDETAQYNVREVYAACILAMTVRKFYENETRVVHNLKMTVQASVIWTRMVYRVLDTLYSVDVAPSWVGGVVRAQLAMFFLHYVAEKEIRSAKDYDASFDSVLNVIAKAQHVKVSDVIAKGAVADGQEFLDYVEENWGSLKGLMNKLSQVHPVLKDLDITTFLRKFIMMYGEKSLLMLESYAYFLGFCFTVTAGGNLVKDFALQSAVDKEGVDLYNAFFSAYGSI
jgi:hypothetical protein